MTGKLHDFVHSLDLSAVFTVIGILFLFSGAVAVTLVAPQYVDPTWTTPSSNYQVQMYEVSDPHFYISSSGTGGRELQFVHHLKNGYTLLGFKESDAISIETTPELEKYVTRKDDKELKLTSRLLLLRQIPANNNSVLTMELYDPNLKDAFASGSSDGVLQDWAYKDYVILDEHSFASSQKEPGVIYISNPTEFRISFYQEGGIKRWKYNVAGTPISSLSELTSPPLAFSSRKELIAEGEHVYAIEGCWYCHTDQTRTLIQDVVLNGSDSYPAPPSMPNEYIYQNITFPGTKRNGPDLSRVAIKRPSRDWHMSHFWSPKTESKGSIMPSFRHFFDFDPRGKSDIQPGVPNRQFEAIFQYLMTKGSRITSPNEAWWLGKDPINTKEIIEGRKRMP